MIIIIEILFALWVLWTLLSVSIGIGQILLGILAGIVSGILYILAYSIEIFCVIWRTAFPSDN